MIKNKRWLFAGKDDETYCRSDPDCGIVLSWSGENRGGSYEKDRTKTDHHKQK